MAKYTGNVYEGKNGDWYWKILAKNGNIIANGGEGYKNRNVALKMLNNILTANQTNDVEIVLEQTEAEKLKEAKKLAKAKKL